MTKKTAALILIFLLSLPLSAQIFTNQNDFHLEVEPAFSYTNGFLGEYFYYHYLVDDSKKMSYLEWDKKIFMYGAEISSSFKRFHLDSRFMIAASDSKSGEMTDSDWQNESDFSMKTTYSVGGNNAAKNYSAEASVYFDFFPAEKIALSPMVQVQYDFDSFECEKMEGWKSNGKHWWFDESSTHYPYVDSDGKTYKLGEIDYYRHSFYTWAGFKICLKPAKRFDFDFSALVSPYAYFYSLDTHWAQEKSTKEMFEKHRKQYQAAFFPAFKLEAKASFSITKIFDLTFAASGLFSVKINRGKWEQDFYDDFLQDDYYDTYQDSGADMQYICARIGCKVRIM